ncbi:uncharacterized protein N7487_008439, partial [Penicillium crustosum]|uniref:uncharacterized protein n=1 Tax=Penicillium crustosum TaxID=36656 RepID=UPI002393977B
MHEPIYGFHRHGLAPESLTPENSEKFDVATVSAQSALGSRAFDPCFCFGHVPSTEPIIKPVANAMPFIAGYIRVFDLWTRFWEEGGEKATARPTRQRQRQRLSYTHPGVGIADLTVFIE